MVMAARQAEPDREALLALERVLAPALGDREAARRPALAPLDDEAARRLEAIDRVIALMAKRGETLGHGGATRVTLPTLVRRAPGAPLEMPEPPELPAATRPDVEVDNLHEIPPLPPSITAEPPPLPPPAASTRSRPRPAPGALLAALPAEAPAARLLYEDILWLVSINDWKAAMVSIERLLVTVRLEGTLKEFFEFNEVKLLNLFESFLGSFTLVPKRRKRTLDNAMPEAYERAEKLHAVLALVDGARTLKDILRESPYLPLETCSALSQARRCGVIEI